MYGGFVSAIAEDGERQLYIADRDQRLGQVRISRLYGDTVERILTLDMDVPGGPFIHTLAVDDGGDIWCSTLEGVSCLHFSPTDSVHIQTLTVADGLPHNHVRCIYCDREGHLWFGTDGGVAHYDGQILQAIRSLDIGPTRRITQDDDGHLWFATTERVVCYTPGAIPSRAEIVQIEAGEVFPDGKQAVAMTGQQIAFEYRGMSFNTHADGMLYRYRFAVQAIDRDLNTSVVATADLQVVRDVRAEQIDEIEERVREHTRELAEREAPMEGVISSAIDCVIVIDHESRILEFNPAAERTFGHSRSSVMGQQLSDMLIFPSSWDQHEQGLQHFLTAGEASILGRRMEIAGRARGAHYYSDRPSGAG